jgi:hypothetical protein
MARMPSIVVTALGAQHRVAQFPSGAGLARRERGHGAGGNGGPRDAERRVPRMVAHDENQADWISRYSASAENANPIRRRPRRCRSSPVPDSSQITTVEAPISISESRLNPASATDRAVIAAMARITMPTTFQPSVRYSSTNPRHTAVAVAVQARFRLAASTTHRH